MTNHNEIILLFNDVFNQKYVFHSIILQTKGTTESNKTFASSMRHLR